MPSKLTVASVIAEFMDGVNAGAAGASGEMADTIRLALKDAFVSGISSGAALVTRAFEQSKTPADLEAHLTVIQNDIADAVRVMINAKAH